MHVRTHILKALFLSWFLATTLIVCAQQDSLLYNSAYWNGYADKLQLAPADRMEFIQAHKRLKDGVPQIVSTPMMPAAKHGTVSTFSGPCVNADFETGNFTGWNRTSGFHPLFNATGCCPNANGQQLITSGAGVDPYGGFPVVFPGGNFSLRLGNNGTGGQADRLEQSFLVSTSNANFTYRYAVVLEDPGHSANQQPAFLVEMLDSTGAQVPCTYYYVAAGQGIPGFFNSPTAGVIYKPWTAVALNLNPYIGQVLTIRFTTYDCSLGGHFGYAYIDGVCQAFTGNGADTICAGTNTNFCAPSGMASYTWNGPGLTNLVGQCATVSAQGIYTVQTDLFTGCPGPSFTYTLTTQNAPTVTASNNLTVCANNPSVNVTSTITGYPASPQWTTTGTGILSALSASQTGYMPSASEISNGSTTLIVNTINNGKCGIDADSVFITITPAPLPLTGGTGSICSNTSYPFNASINSTFTALWTTNGTGTFVPNTAALNATYFPSQADIIAATIPFTLTSTNNSNCLAVTNTFVLNIQNQPTLVASPLPTLCSTASFVVLTSTINGVTTTGQWLSNGTGTLVQAGNSGANYFFSAADLLQPSLLFTLQSTNNGVCATESLTTTLSITPLATVTAGAHQRICSTQNTIALNANIIGGTTTGSWTTNGTGTFQPGATTLNGTYLYSTADIQTGLISFSLSSINNGVCNSVNDTLTVRLVPQPTLVAIPDRTLCSHLPTVPLTATLLGITSSGIWQTTGSGTIANTNTPVTIYSFSPVDILNSPLYFTLTTTNNDVCIADSKTTAISIVPIATVDAGINQWVCSAQNTIAVSGTIIGITSSGNWLSSSGGAFNPANNLSTFYTLNNADMANGFVTFSLSSVNNGTCPAQTDTVRMKIMRQPTLTISNSGTICSIQPSFAMSGTLNGGVGTTNWLSNGSGSFTTNSTIPSNTYQVHPSDIQNGLVVFTLTSTGASPCAEATKTLQLQITKLAQVVAGAPQIVCSNTPTLSLQGTIGGGATTGTWAVNGTGGYPIGNVPVTTYTLSGADRFKTQLIFTLTSTDNGVCPAVRDTMRITLHTLPVVKAGADKGICNTQSLVPLNGQVSGYTNAGVWSTTGAGSFVPSATLLNITYSLMPADFIKGNVLFILTSTNNGVCPEVTDTILVTIDKAPILKLKGDSVRCEKQNPISLTADITLSGGVYEWSSSGTGTFIPNSQRVNVDYLFSAADVKAGYVYFNFTTKNNGACGDIAFSRQLQILPSAKASFIASSYSLTLPDGSINLTNLSKQATLFNWWFGDGENSTAKDVTHTYRATGYYDIMLVANNTYNCSDTTLQRITVISEALFPNAFTPNTSGPGDGSYNPLDNTNDVFFPFTDGVVNYDLQIYNRWGELIFRSTDVKIGWDGYFNGKLCQQDTYVWKANMEFFDGRKLVKAGTITLLR